MTLLDISFNKTSADTSERVKEAAKGLGQNLEGGCHWLFTRWVQTGEKGRGQAEGWPQPQKMDS
jgi:hypothetical protein